MSPWPDWLGVEMISDLVSKIGQTNVLVILGRYIGMEGYGKFEELEESIIKY